MATISPEARLSRLQAILAVEQVFLPPKITQHEDAKEHNPFCEHQLLSLVLEALAAFRDTTQNRERGQLDAAIMMIDYLLWTNGEGGVMQETSLRERIHVFAQTGGMFPIHVRAQNAAILLTFERGVVYVEPFELSPEDEQVVGTIGRLKRQFPDLAIALHGKTFWEQELQETLIQALVTMSNQEVAEMKQKTTGRKRPDNEQADGADTTSPAIVTDLLTAFLSPMGDIVQLPRIQKHTREEVVWSKAGTAWRRSPVWLLVRVSLQVLFARFDPDSSLYKEFMIFFMAHMLQSVQAHNLPSDLTSCMVAKVSRRLLKLDADRIYTWLPQVQGILLAQRQIIQDKWEGIIQQSEGRLSIPSISAEDVQQGIIASYPELDQFIERIKLRKALPDKWIEMPEVGPSWVTLVPKKEEMPSFSNLRSNDELPYRLAAFEEWVAVHLDNWLILPILESPTTPECLCLVAKDYHRLASEYYKGNPEGISIMILTLVEIWTACDKSATEQDGLLLNYNPEIPLEPLESLILPSKHHLQRLFRVEEYVKTRLVTVNRDFPSIFTTFGLENSFAVAYFDQSERLQKLRQTIERTASHHRENKRRQFHELRAEFDRLMELYNSVPHDKGQEGKDGDQEEHDEQDCQRCRYKQMADLLSIRVHEWPLPCDESTAKAIVFELKVPKPFNYWRNMCMFFRLDVLQCPYSEEDTNQPRYNLEDYFPKVYDGMYRRLFIASREMPGRALKMRQQIGNAEPGSIFVRNGANWWCCDREKGMFQSNKTHVVDRVVSMCSYQLSEENAGLQAFLSRPFDNPNGLSANDVLARQSFCHQALTLEEFKGMATLPVGFRLPWLNLLANLFVPSVEFGNLDTILIIMQATGQAGPSFAKSYLRSAHQVFKEELFSDRLLRGLELALDRVGEDWDSCLDLAAIMMLGVRQLNMTSSATVAFRTYAFLQTSRRRALSWMVTLQCAIRDCDNDDERKELTVNLFKVALVNMSSLFMHSDYVDNIFLNNSPDPFDTMYTSMIIQMTLRSCLDSSENFYRNLTQKWRHFMQNTHVRFRTEILTQSSVFLDLAIKKHWQTYPGSSGWGSMTDSSGRISEWVWTRTPKAENHHQLHVCFNLLTAELLIHGQPLGQLPSEYKASPSLKAMFGTSIQVVPGNVPHTQFYACKTYTGHQVFFGKDSQNGGFGEPACVVIKDRGKSEERTFEVIPPSVFERVFGRVLPLSLVRNYVHWYDEKADVVEFRLKEDPWEFSEDDWKMMRRDSSWTLVRGGRNLLHAGSPALRSLLSLFSGMEEEGYVIATVDADRQRTRINIELTRLNLEFFIKVDSDVLHCQQHMGFHIDTLPSVGTLVGLQSKMVLIDKRGHRRVLIPNGQVQWKAEEDHICVSAIHGTSTQVFSYDVDELFGRLIHHGSLEAKLMLLHLHALTSHCLPDPLTARTGTEQALLLLNSAAVGTFEQLSEQSVDTLKAIARLSPRLTRHPKDKPVRGKVDWDPHLSCLSQNLGFRRSVQSILSLARSKSFFYEDSNLGLGTLDVVADPQPEARHSIRASVFSLHGFGAEHHTADKDADYRERGRFLGSIRSVRAFTVSTSALERRKSMYEAPMLSAQGLYSFLESPMAMSVSSEVLPAEFITYDAQWLENPRRRIVSTWCQLHATLAGSKADVNWTQVVLCLTTIAYSQMLSDPRILPTLIAFATLPELKRLTPPDASIYRLCQGHTIQLGRIREIAAVHTIAFADSADDTLEAKPGEEVADFEVRKLDRFEKNAEVTAWRLARLLAKKDLDQPLDFPIDDPKIKRSLKVEDCQKELADVWKSWHRNDTFWRYLCKLCDIVNKSPVREVTLPKPTLGPIANSTEVKRRTHISDGELFGEFTAPKAEVWERVAVPGNEWRLDLIEKSTAGQMTVANRGMDLVHQLKAKAKRPYEREFAEDLGKSFGQLKARHTTLSPVKDDAALGKALHRNLRSWEHIVNIIYGRLRATVQPTSSSGQAALSAVEVAGALMGPRISPAFFLQQLASNRWMEFPQGWREAFVLYGVALTNLQQARRMLKILEDGGDLVEELTNLGHANWRPLDYPKFLLLEVESDIMISEEQFSIAASMMDPPNNANAVMQMNLGLGKSAVIIPIVAAHLANRKTLVRILVTRPQAKTLYDSLVTKLGGLLGIRIYRLPMARRLELTESDAETIGKLHRQCMATGGVMLMEPEHALSLKLMGLESIHGGDSKIGRSLLETQHFVDSHARDIVDEWDEVLSTGSEVAYAMGKKQVVPYTHDRWLAIQDSLCHFLNAAVLVQRDLPASIEFLDFRNDGSFPRIRILREEAMDQVLNKLAETIAMIGVPGLPVELVADGEPRASLTKYLYKEHLSEAEINAVEKHPAFRTEHAKAILLVIRGLIAGGLLAFAFSRVRWRANFGFAEGLEPFTHLAVPYLAKDYPKPRANYSHTDVEILLTCLAHYYGGMSDEKLDLLLCHLRTTIEGECDFIDWTIKIGGDMSRTVDSLSGAHARDPELVKTRVFPRLRYFKDSTDIFLTHVLLPREMRESLQRISASSWDMGKPRLHPTTGISSTSDAKHLLPVSVQYLDSQDQHHINAFMIDRILGPENAVQVLAAGETTVKMVPVPGGSKKMWKMKRVDNGENDPFSNSVLAFALSTSPAVQVIIDAGGHLIEMNNSQAARLWLTKSPPADGREAAIYYDEKDDLCVVDRAGFAEGFLASPYSRQMDRCLVFLDEAHIRGTELKLPSDARALITLGPGMTKDKLVQACMTMSQLGQGQSAVFCIPKSLARDIRWCLGGCGGKPLCVTDIVMWSITKTHEEMRRSMPVWAAQRAVFMRQQTVWAEAADGQVSRAQMTRLLEDVDRSLVHLYGPQRAKTPTGNLLPSSERPDDVEVYRRCEAFGCSVQGETVLEQCVQVEREVDPSEDEHRVPRLPEAEPWKNAVHADLLAYVATGLMKTPSPAFMPAFHAFKSTSATDMLNMNEFPRTIQVTGDFMRTVIPKGGRAQLDWHQRPVQWILRSNKKAGTLLIISPHEAQEVYLDVKKSAHVSLHLYAARRHVLLPSLDHLSLWSVQKPQTKVAALPTATRLLLNIFAGQWCFSSYLDYKDSCRMMGLAWQPASSGMVVDADGFISKRPKPDPMCIVSKSPVPFLRLLMTRLRGETEEFDESQWGRVLNGEILAESDIRVFNG